MPTFLGGNENLDPRQICANLLRRPLYEISEELFEMTCKQIFKEKITSYSYVIIALLIGIYFYHIISLIHEFISCKISGKNKPITIINEILKPQNPWKKFSYFSIQKNNENKKIYFKTRELLQKICDIISLDFGNDSSKINTITNLLKQPEYSIIKRDISCKLLNNNNNNNKYLLNTN